ncbi:MAG: hypothetical protein J5653_00995 [Clostridiales bacterium]|nr:hypothetical protein [Clostridiales bacterium]
MEQLTSDFWRSKGKFNLVEDSTERSVWLSGLVSYEDEKTDVSEFVDRFLAGTLNFNRVIGWFRIVIFTKKDSIWYFFGDNSNSQHFFYDEKTGVFCDSLLGLKEKMSSELEPNYEAITNMMAAGYSIGKETIVSGILRTDKTCYYSFDGTKITEKSKGLQDFIDLKHELDVVSVLRPIEGQTKDKKIAAVCTGGTDSRAIMSGLRYLKAEPKYVITGHDDNPDLKVVYKIADKLGEPLKLIHLEDKEDGWLEKGFNFTDGEYDPVLSYRHYLKAQWEIENSIEFEFGGLAGEYYKNVFCQPFLWLFKKKDADFYFNTILDPHVSSLKWMGAKAKEAGNNNKSKLKAVADQTNKEKTLLEKGNRVGFDVLSWKSGAITNGYSSVVTKVDPLMDRQLCAYASHDNCISHSMHKWQRKQVEKYCKDIAALPTDQGYTCSMNPFRYLRDCFKKLGFYLDRVFNRFRRKLGLGFKSVEQRFWDKDYETARKTELWQKSLAYCKEKEIIDPNVAEETIPLSKTGWIILVGLLFA